MASDPRALFAGIDNARASFASDYERDGHYIERIDRVKAGKKHNEEPFMAIEKTVVFVYPDTYERFEAEGKPADRRPHVVGDDVSHLLMRRHESFLPNVKALVSRIYQVTPEQVTLETCVGICDEQLQPMAQMFVECRNRQIRTRKGQPFTKIDYVRRVPASEVLEILTANKPELIGRMFPDGKLDALIAAEADEAAAAG